MGCVEETWCHGVCVMMFLRRDNHMQNKEYIQKMDFEYITKCTRSKNRDKRG